MRRADDEPLPEQLLRYVARFDRGEFWLAHEELEDLWHLERSDFLKGLIHAAAGFLHIERNNWRGARRLLTTALTHLDEAPARYRGFDVDGIRERLRAALACVEELAAGRRRRFDAELGFRLAPLLATTVPADIVADVALPYRVARYDDGYRPVRRTED